MAPTFHLPLMQSIPAPIIASAALALLGLGLFAAGWAFHLSPLAMRKAIHILTGPVFLLCLNRFPMTLWGSIQASLYPASLVVALVVSQQVGRGKVFMNRGESKGTAGVAVYGVVFAVVPFLRGWIPCAHRGIFVFPLEWAALVLALGDGVAAFGSILSKARWAHSPNKSQVGTLLFAIASFVGILAFRRLCPWMEHRELEGRYDKLLIPVLVAALVESLPLKEWDNILVIATPVVLSLFPVSPAAFAVGACVASLALWRRWVDGGGAVVGLVVYIIHSASDSITMGHVAVVCLATFLIAGSTMTHGRKDRKGRGWSQVAANSGCQCLVCVLLCVRKLCAMCWPMGVRVLGSLDWTLYAIASGYAGALGDTASSEIGSTSKSRPRDIIGFRCVPVGYNGGVTAKGLWAAAGSTLVFGVIIGAVFPATKALCLPGGYVGECRVPAVSRWAYGLVADRESGAVLEHLLSALALGPLMMAAGVFCSLVDSLLGSLLQYTGVTADGAVTEDRGCGRRVSRHSLLNNNQVNATSIGLTMCMSCMLRRLVQ